MTWRKNGLKRAYAVTIVEEERRAGFHAWKTEQLFPCFTRIQCKIASQKARLTLPNKEIDTWKFADKIVCGSHMINVGVGESDAANRRAQGSCCFAYAGRRSGEAGIDESEPIVFPDQKTIDHAEASQTK